MTIRSLLVFVLLFNTTIGYSQLVEFGLNTSYGFNYNMAKVLHTDMKGVFKPYAKPLYLFQVGFNTTFKKHYFIEAGFKRTLISYGNKSKNIAGVGSFSSGILSYADHSNILLNFGYKFHVSHFSILPYAGVNIQFDNNYNSPRTGYTSSSNGVSDSLGIRQFVSDRNDSVYFPRPKVYFGIDMGVRLGYTVKLMSFTLSMGYQQGLQTYYLGRYITTEYNREPLLQTGDMSHLYRTRASYFYTTVGVEINFSYLTLYRKKKTP